MAIGIRRVDKKVEELTPKAPEELSVRAKEHWDYIAPKIASNGLLMKGDFKILGMACEFYALYENSLKDGDAAEARKNAEQYMKIIRDFGFTPKSRQMMKSNEVQMKAAEKKVNPAADFFDEE